LHTHKDADNVMQIIYQIIAAYFEEDCSYVIRLKENKILRELAADMDDALTEATRFNIVDYAVVYGDFMYQANSWMTQ